MFNKLLKLYKKHTNKTPLEDFTTEALVGILNLNEEIKASYITNFLNLPEDKYQIRTQSKYPLQNDIDCIIDIVIEGDNNICFIENKVDSSEGHRQLERYSKVLNTYFLEKSTFLFYCTKYYDKRSFQGNNFKQFRWFELAKFLKQYRDNSLINSFLMFLKKHDMDNDLIFSAKDFITFNNLQNVIDKTSIYLERAKPFFEESFNLNGKITDGRTIKDILKHNRLVYIARNIVEGDGYSEFKYGFQLEKPNVYISIWIDKSNFNHKELSNLVERNNYGFLIYNYDIGMAIELKNDISEYLNNEDAEIEIVNWFKDACEKLVLFINKTKEVVKWKIIVA